MTHAEAGAEQVIYWRRDGLTATDCLVAMGYPPDRTPSWRMVAGVVEYESRRLTPTPDISAPATGVA